MISKSTIKKKHSDLQRSNSSNVTVQGCIYPEINKYCIKTLLKDAEKDCDNKLLKEQVKELLEIANKSNKNPKISWSHFKQALAYLQNICI